MLEAIGGFLFLVLVIAVRIIFSPRMHRVIDGAIKDHTVSNLDGNLDLYEQMKAAKARGETVTPPSSY